MRLTASLVLHGPRSSGMGQVNDSWGAEVLKPANDKRIYKCLKLSNELQVLLVSDAETDMVRSATQPLPRFLLCSSLLLVSKQSWRKHIGSVARIFRRPSRKPVLTER